MRGQEPDNAYPIYISGTGSSIPMRGQESAQMLVRMLTFGVIHPHEGSGDQFMPLMVAQASGHPSP